MNVGIVLLLLLLVLAFFGIPIYISLGIGTVVAMTMSGTPLLVLPQKLFYGMNSSSLLAIPFFVLAGTLMSRSITNKLVDIANAMIGQVRGALAIVTILASAVFGAISGSGVATASAIGGLMIPAMKKEKYPPEFAVATASISSILGPIIPPSIVLIVYSSITNVSVADLFIGSLIPGILMAGAFIVYALVYGKKHNLPAHEKSNVREVGHAFKEGIWALLMPVIILGGIFGGIFSATEAAVVAVVYALIISLFVYKDTKWSEIPELFVSASITTAVIMIMVGLSKASTYVIVVSYLPQQLLAFFASATSSKYVILLMLNLLLLVVGMLMEANAAVIMLTPIVLPLLTGFGIDPMAFGIIMSMNLCIGLVTPPVGLCLLIGNQIGETSLSKSLRAMFPMLIIAIVVLLLCTYITPLTTWLPSIMS